MSDRRPENPRDIVDPYVAEALYDETIAWNIDMRGGGSVAEWPSWEELPDMAREHWMSMAVTARVAARAAMESANSADLLAVVRRGVESGTIEGEVGRVEGASVMSQEHTELLVWVSRDVAREIVRGGVDVLVIPVSDGGEDRP